MTENCSRAAKMSKCLCLGDINLDYFCWNSPEPSHTSMVNRTKLFIENRGSTQIVSTVTRSWNWQRDTLIDHIWLNCQDSLLNFSNIVRSASDHNVISCNLSLVNTIANVFNVLKRSWKKFNISQYREELLNAD